MKNLITCAFSSLILFVAAMTLTGCSESDSTPLPVYTIINTLSNPDEDPRFPVAGEYIDKERKYTFYGLVKLYKKNGCSEVFPCVEGSEGLDEGCRGVLDNNFVFQNLDRNEWVNINGEDFKSDKIFD